MKTVATKSKANQYSCEKFHHTAALDKTGLQGSLASSTSATFRSQITNFNKM